MEGPSLLQFVPFVLFAVMFAGAFWVFGTIMKKIGRPSAWAVLLLIPLVNVRVLIWLACSEWPIQTELSKLSELSAAARKPMTTKALRVRSEVRRKI